nr:MULTISPECIES: FctA domain-containing protein [Bifidobacterium]
MVVQRSISGIVWYDVNGDGIRSSEDILLKDVKVTLLNDTDEKPAKSVVTPHDDLSTKSDSQGKYELTNIPAGKFHLRFDPAPNTNWTHLTTTIQKADTATQSENSSASDFLEDGTMKGAVINDIEFQKAEDMVDAASQSLDFNNCGLTGMMDTDEVSAGVEVRIQGRNWLGTDSFALNVKPLDGAPSAALPSQITINADNQNTQVPVNVYDLPGDGSYRYRIHQETGSIPGLTYDQTAAILTITLTTDAARLHRTAKAQWTGSKGSKIDTAVFTNTYQAKPATVKLTAFKHLEGPGLKAGEFDFLLQDKKGGKPAQASNKANGTVEFPDQTLSEAGDYTYSVSEAQGSLPGITYDQNTHQIAVHVTDDQQGQLQATVTDNNPTFTNTYQAKPDKPDQPDNPADPGNSGNSGNSGEHDKPNPPVEPSKPSESDRAPSKPDQTGSDSQKTAPGSQSSDGQAKSSTDSPALAASGSDPVMPAALTFGTAVLGLALMCLLRHRRNREADLG